MGKSLAQLGRVLAEPLAYVYNKLLEEEAVPDIWKISSVCPVFKNGSKGDPGNYRQTGGRGVEPTLAVTF